MASAERGHTDCVSSVAVSRDRIVSGSFDRTVKIWNWHGECLKTLEGHSDYVTSVAILNGEGGEELSLAHLWTKP